MAKWEERDPRWIVEKRPDGTNVNNWHWTEKNASCWSKNKLSELFIGLKVKADFGQCEITEMLNCHGEAVVNNRKGKLIFFYEWNLELKWKGVLNRGPTVEGRVTVSNLTEEQEAKDVHIIVYFDDDGGDSTALGNLMQCNGPKIIQEQLSAYVVALQEDFSKDLILPTHFTPDIKMDTVSDVSQKWQPNDRDTLVNVSECNTEIRDLYSTEIFKCTAEEFYRVLTVKEFVLAFTQSDCVLESIEGGKFELFDGNVEGFFIKLEPFERIVLKWRFTPWPKDHFSDVIINIEQKTDCTEVKFSQFGIPKEELENTKVGWKRYYWDSIKRTFGFGAFLF